MAARTIQSTAARWVFRAILLLMAVSTLAIWVGSWTHFFPVTHNLTIAGQTYGVSVLAGRHRLIVGAVNGRALVHPVRWSRLAEDSCRHRWGLEWNPENAYLVFPIPILFLIPIALWLLPARFRSRPSFSG